MNVRVAVIDSGIGATDRLGHGTVVAAIIRENAPKAELVDVRVFETRLACNIESLVRAIEWCASNAIDIANLSVGTANPSHAEPLLRAVERARAAGVTIVSAYGWLPGNLPDVIAVDEDRTCHVTACRVREVGGRRILACSGFGKGASFAVANATGLLARALADAVSRPLDLLDLLVAQPKL